MMRGFFSFVSNKHLLLVVAMIAGMIFNGQSYAQQKSQSDLFWAEIGRIADSYHKNEISAPSAANEMKATGRAYFPNDGIVHAYVDSLAEYLIDRSKGKISAKKVEQLVISRTERFNEALKERYEFNKERQSKIDEENRIKIAQQELERWREYELQQAFIEEQRRRAAVGMMLRGIGNSFRNAYGQ